MSITRRNIRRICVLASLVALSVCANAFMFDTRIIIDRALNSPTLTIRYSGATAALVELKVNGESLGTRPVNAAKTSGETNFTLNLASLHDGDNTVEVCLFDKAGKLVGTEKTVISTDNAVRGPVYLTSPKVGATVRGPVEINVGFGRDLRNSYVSFFIDNQFKSLTNSPPFNYVWDTQRESNGWHEVEAWVVDDSSTTFKTRKIRVFVNNEGGRTERIVVPSKPPVDLHPIANTTGATTGAASGIKATKAAGAATVAANVTAVAPVLTGAVIPNKVQASSLGATSGQKPVIIEKSVATGPRDLTPTGTRVAGAAAIKAVNSAAGTIAITKGQKLPNLPAFSIVYNSSVVKFDVAPRVQDGVPMTPFRHLLEKAGGKVDWEAISKTVNAQADGREIYIQIGDKIAKINKLPVEMEIAPFLEHGRTIVPLSFMRETLNVNIEYDKATGHVLITSIKK